MTIGDKAADAALEWIGTPLKEQQSVKGVGCDCKGLISGVARDIGRPEGDSEYATDINYSLRKTNGIPHERFKEGVAALFKPVKGKWKRGDILLCRLGKEPAHLAIYVGNDEAVHVQISSKAWVKKTKLRVLFHFFPLDSVWRWKSK